MMVGSLLRNDRVQGTLGAGDDGAWELTMATPQRTDTIDRTTSQWNEGMLRWSAAMDDVRTALNTLVGKAKHDMGGRRAAGTSKETSRHTSGLQFGTEVSDEIFFFDQDKVDESMSTMLQKNEAAAPPKMMWKRVRISGSAMITLLQHSMEGVRACSAAADPSTVALAGAARASRRRAGLARRCPFLCFTQRV